MFRVELQQKLTEFKTGEVVSVNRGIELPFAPYVGLIIGLLPESHWEQHVNKATSVLWHNDSQQFLVRLDDIAVSDIREALKQPRWTLWKLTLYVAPSAAEAIRDVEESELDYAIEIDHKFTAVSQIEFDILNDRGFKTEVLYRPGDKEE